MGHPPALAVAAAPPGSVWHHRVRGALPRVLFGIVMLSGHCGLLPSSLREPGRRRRSSPFLASRCGRPARRREGLCPYSVPGMMPVRLRAGRMAHSNSPTASDPPQRTRPKAALNYPGFSVGPCCHLSRCRYSTQRKADERYADSDPRPQSATSSHSNKSEKSCKTRSICARIGCWSSNCMNSSLASASLPADMYTRIMCTR